eukprot:s114_g20.t1
MWTELLESPNTTPKKKPRGDVSPMPSRTSSPQQSKTPSEAFASPLLFRRYPPGPAANEPSEVALLNEENSQLRKSLLNSEDMVGKEELRCLNVWRNSEENAKNIEMTVHDGFVIMNGQLRQLRTKFQESLQEDEGSAYRIKELERFRTLSEEVAAHINMKYQMMQTEHEEQMACAQNVIENIGSQANVTVDELRSQLSGDHNCLIQEINSYVNLENAVQYEANSAIQENECVNQLHVELQEQRMINFQPKAEAERNISSLENSDGKGTGASFGGHGDSGSDDRIEKLKLLQELGNKQEERIMIVESLEDSHIAELKKIRDELTEMEAKKDKYKSYYTQLDEHIPEEEATCKAESEAYERIRN